jgi:conserved repeat domain
LYPASGTYYVLTEETPPVGYTGLASPIYFQMVNKSGTYNTVFGTYSTPTFTAHANAGVYSDYMKVVENLREVSIYNTLAPMAPTTTTLELNKVVTGVGAPDNSFDFTVTFTGDLMDFSAVTVEKTGGSPTSFTSGGTVSLKAGEKAIFTKVPVGAEYTISEDLTGLSDYKSDKTDNKATGMVAGGGSIVTFTNTYTAPSPPALEYDAALQKWVMAVNGTLIAANAETTPNTAVPVVNTGDKVTFAIKVINQYETDLTIAEISDYMPAGYTFVPTENPDWPDWILESGILKYRKPIELSGKLLGGVEDFEIIHLVLTVNATGGLRNTAEISVLKDGDNRNPVADRDSTPDANQANDGTPKDNVVTENYKSNDTLDEDDHDYAEVKRPAPPTNPPTTTEPPATTEPPVTTEPPATTEPPETTEPPVTTEPTETTAPPTPTEPTAPPYTPGGNDPEVMPMPSTPTGTLIPSEDGWIELDPDGTPLGKWTWDEEEEEWIFEDIPLGALPPTGYYGIPSYLFFLMSIALVGILFVVVRKSSKATK